VVQSYVLQSVTPVVVQAVQAGEAAAASNPLLSPQLSHTGVVASVQYEVVKQPLTVLVHAVQPPDAL